jgi:hypothetical protein
VTTSGTTSFSLNLNDIAEEAFERCGAELRSGYDLRTARRSLNLMMLEWANRGLNLWTIEQGAIALVPGVASYNLPADTVDVIEHVLRTGAGASQSDLNMPRISVSTYATIPNKTATGRPVQMLVTRGPALSSVTVWPVPDASAAYTLVYWRLRRMQDAGAGVNTQDVPFRFLPVLVSGLAYYLSLKLPGAFDRAQVLKAEYEEQWMQASSEDREKAPVMMVPRMYG